ncbi:peptidoglycan editing factor PgeF [Massilia sp. 9096]|uniref:peptidoglycan editing factor PgeF n=1 Tax=Massilia sp. 9096 TaxID=1500894 RepID=UPI00068BA0A9|nr:peptidoglycan editing factor PgeF [Massilia sp. 9096]
MWPCYPAAMLTSPLLHQTPHILHGFGTRHDDLAACFPALWPRRPIQHERHGTRIAIVTEPNQDGGEADGMFTDRPGLLLAIATADCVPILLARRDGAEVAALHAGWRGAMHGIVDAFADLVRTRGGAPGDWIAAAGPAAHACCYQVGPEVVDGFVERWGFAPEVVAPRPRMLDLPAIVRLQLARAGFASIDARTECTMCHQRDDGHHTFHSYRRDRATRTPVVDVHWSAIAIAPR